MKNVTISMDEELAQRTRVAAARAGKSVSKYIADSLREFQTKPDADEVRRRLDALQKVFDGPKLQISENGRMPTAEQRNARR